MKASKRKIKYIVVHCTATKEGYDFTAKQIGEWHKQLGWAGIGYNYVVRLDGSIEAGRHVDEVPSHVKGYNANSIGVVYVGGLNDNMQPKDTRTKLQKASLLQLLTDLKKLYPAAIIQGHRDFPKVAKACPCFDAKTEYKTIL
jgi:N-acetylmuramoyl-L-alanine amidase